MTRYAERTEVPADRSRAEIENVLRRYGATGFSYGWDGNLVGLGFTMRERKIRFLLAMPDRDSEAFTHVVVRRHKKRRAESAAAALYERATRQKWRALLLVIKAKLEAIEAQISDFEDEFCAFIVLPDGRTVGDVLKPQIASAYLGGEAPKLLPFRAAE